MSLQTIETKIYEIRGLKIMLDFDLAEMYETETKYLKRAVKANLKRFPSDFMITLTQKEWDVLRCNFSTSNKRGGTRYLPFAFTEQGVAMLSAVLKSEKAIDVNLSIMRAFVLIRQYALSHKDLSAKLKELEETYNTKFKDVYEALNYLLKKEKTISNQKKRTQIGYQIPKK